MAYAMKRIIRGAETALLGALAVIAVAAPNLAHTQTPVVIGYPANFDAFNNTGVQTHGFEIEADGINETQVTRVFGNAFSPGTACVIRYCAGTVTPFPGGVKIRWASPYDQASQQFTLSTPLPNGTVATGESCWTLGLGARYPAAGCEHFGISTSVNATKIIYRWLVEDPANPGQLMYFAGTSTPVAGAPAPAPIPVQIPQPVINVLPPAVAGDAPIVQFNIEVPAPPPAVEFQPVAQAGDAQWVKVYKLEMNSPVDLNDLMGGNVAVPEAPQAAETEWKMLQYNPDGKGPHRALVNGGPLGRGSRAVVRRYEHYQYSGTYDPTTHVALCGGDGSCSAPLPGELGVIIGAQNAAANVVVPSLTVAQSGGGTVSSADRLIRCGTTCSATYPAGTQVGLSETPPNNAVFTGWGGACSGTQTTCNVAVNDAVLVSATFTPLFQLSVSRNGNGSVMGTPYGEAPTFISCGQNCTANFQKGTVVTLTATPAGGTKFIGWSGSCAGLNPVCNVTMSTSLKAQANFK